MALVLKRKYGEAIVVGEGENCVRIQVKRPATGSGVALVIDAPTHIRVDREEVRQRIVIER